MLPLIFGGPGNFLGGLRLSHERIGIEVIWTFRP